MSNLSDNLYLRKCFLEREQVPTQSMIKKKMGTSLANVYFKSMNPKLKVLVGLEPPMKGGGSDWYMPPEEILKGRAVLKPVKKELLEKMTHNGIITAGTNMFIKRRKALKYQREETLAKEDEAWRIKVKNICQQEWKKNAEVATKKNGEFIHNAFRYFTILYRKSLDNFESLFHEAAIAEIKKTRENAIQYMQQHYAAALKKQATLLYDEYEVKLNNEKERLKVQFIKKVEESRSEIAEQVHDLRIDKHVAIEKLRQFFECQNLACQIYVALKERDMCLKNLEEVKYKHKKVIKTLDEDIAFKNMEIYLEKLKESKRTEFRIQWQKKVCRVVKNFQMFVTYCLNMLPEHADFFINMEKLMLLQINNVIDEPDAESIIEVEEEKIHTPIPRPHPYYLCCDRGYKAQVNQDLCPKHCTSSASQLPVIIINKRCLYAACDNFEQFTFKLKQYILGKRGDDTDFIDSINSAECMPVKYTASQQLSELKLETSLLQLLQQEIPNVQDVSIKCGFCGTPHCFCRPSDPTPPLGPTQSKEPSLRSSSDLSSHAPTSLTRGMELIHEREPKMESYFEYMEPTKCTCAKTAKKHLTEYLPAYMRRMSKYDQPDIPNYERCSVEALKTLVKKARGPPPPPPPAIVPPKYKDVGTQYVDTEFEMLCNCFSKVELDRFLSDLTINLTTFASSKAEGQLNVMGRSETSSYLTKTASSFATDRARSLLNIVNDSPEILEIFMKNVSL